MSAGVIWHRRTAWSVLISARKEEDLMAGSRMLAKERGGTVERLTPG